MKSIKQLIIGFIIGVFATIIAMYIYSTANNADDGISGLNFFENPGECLTNNSKKKSSEITVIQVIATNAALANLRNYTYEKGFRGEIRRDYDILNDVLVLLINYEEKSYYDDQKIEVSGKCLRQLGTYQYQPLKSSSWKTVPFVVIE
jgi:hypothetical protein